MPFPILSKLISGKGRSFIGRHGSLKALPFQLVHRVLVFVLVVVSTIVFGFASGALADDFKTNNTYQETAFKDQTNITSNDNREAKLKRFLESNDPAVSAGMWYQNRNPDEEPTEVWQKALLYSVDHAVVAFAVYGRAKEATAQKIAEKIKGLLTRQNIKSIYFLENEDHTGSSIGFYLKGMQYGPKALGDIVPVLRQVATHYPQAWPKKVVSRTEASVP